MTKEHSLPDLCSSDMRTANQTLLVCHIIEDHIANEQSLEYFNLLILLTSK